MQTRIELPNGRFLIAAHSKAKRLSQLWAVYLPESDADFHSGSRAELADLIGREKASELNYLVINKAGLMAKGKDADVFERSFRRRLRIQDALKALHEIIPTQDKIILMGYSEGAYLAPELALRLRGRVQGVVMIGGGTRGWLKEELNNSNRDRSVKKLIAKIKRQPESSEQWNGISFATWNSYSSDKTLASLKKISRRTPVLAILGRNDDVIDVKTTLTDLTKLARRKSIHTQIFPRCDHSFAGHWPAVRNSVQKFLQQAIH